MDINSIENIKEAFSRQSLIYDDYELEHPILKIIRQEVRLHVMDYLGEGDKILELNAGTGTDAVFFAQKGYKVHATDIAEGMIKQLKNKVKKHGLNDLITIQKCSFYELDKLNEGPFNYIFSNFGGLNCSPDLKEITKHFPNILARNGRVTLVLMPPICPWELALIFRMHFKTAFRRLKRNGTKSHIEGKYFNTFYYTPHDVLKALGENFKKLKLQGLASFTPPPYMENFPQKYPVLFRNLNKFDKYFSNHFPFNSLADHFILTAQYIPTL
jgi:ubiquinone/menaquinone biosynthesis C-methylase UbiE